MAPAALRALAFFLVVAGLVLPAAGAGRSERTGRVVLLDVSRSMGLPVRDSGGPTRLDSARALLMALDPDRVWLFGDVAIAAPTDSALSVEPSAGLSRVTPALEAARLAGADSVWVITDGDWIDRREAENMAERLGLGVEELRVSAPVRRLGISQLIAERRVRAGDTAMITVEIVVGGEGTVSQGSVRVLLRTGGQALASAVVRAPVPGRFARVELPFVPAAPAGEAEWRRYEVSLAPGADPLSRADRRGLWLEVGEESSGAVMISTDPDWELRFLGPVLERTVLGGVRGFLRMAPERYLEMSARPRSVEGDGPVARAARAARLLVVQADFSDLPAPIAGVLLSHPRKLLLPTSEGAVPGTSVRLGAALAGEWYPSPPVPSGPAAGLMQDQALGELPPMRQLYHLDGSSGGAVLNGRRGRRGEARPLLVTGERGRDRWAVATGTGYWRWAFREGASRRVYEGMISGLVGWLAEDFSLRPLDLMRGAARGEPVRWRVAAGVTEVAIEVVGERGDTLWSGSWSEPGLEIVGPVLDVGQVTITARGEGPDGPFRAERPLAVEADPREMLPVPSSDPLRVVAARSAGSPTIPARRRPVWPFLAAIILLCGEWILRHRAGLR